MRGKNYDACARFPYCMSKKALAVVLVAAVVLLYVKKR